MLAALALPAMGKEISPQEAMQRAQSSSPALMARGAGKATPQLAHTALTEKGEPAVYVFKNANDKGFLLLSADDAAIPVLGYSDHGNFSSSEMPPQLQWWLSEYANQIEYARQTGAAPYTPKKRAISRSGARERIAPQMKTFWDQVEPYNDQCPLSGTDRTWTGCVATAMAQVMKYWNYPEKGQGSITYTIESLEKKVSMNFALKKFDWDNMLDSYINGNYTEEESSAVAYLMKACGYAVKMQYSMDASGALGMNIGKAFVKYFNYDPNILYTLRMYYSSEEWDNMMYENLKNVGPVVYGGGSTLGGGHSFVCDGYDGEGLYHFNWGWSGMSDGYFSLDALNPDALGTGGGTGGGYNFTQDAVFGIQPPTGQPVEERPVFVTQEGELAGSVSGSKLSFSLTSTGEPMWVNYNPETLYLKFGAMFYPQGDTPGEAIYHDIATPRFELQEGYGTNSQVLKPSVNLSSLNLSDGTYKVVVGTVEVPKGTDSSATDGEGFTEVRPRYGYPNSFILKVANGKYSVTNGLLKPLKIKGEIIGDLYYGTLTRVRVTVENPSDVERTSGFAPVFLDSEGPVMLGESIYMTIPPKGTVTREWETSLTQFVQFIDSYFNQQLLFTFFNEADFSFYDSAFSAKVVLKENPGQPTLYFSSPIKFKDSYRQGSFTMIKDCRDIDLTCELGITKGYFNYPVVACLSEPASNNQVMIVCTANQNVYMSADDPDAKTAQIHINMSYPVAIPKAQYYMVLTYQGPSGLVTLTSVPVRFEDISGIGSVEADSANGFSFDRNTSTATVTSEATISSVEVYDISGRQADASVENNGNRATVKIDGKGMFIITVKDADGKQETYKVLN